MKIGVVLPQTEIGNDPAAIKAYAQAVEDMGFTHILVFDHVCAMRGITHRCVHTAGLGLATPDDHVKTLRRFRETVGLA